jgi:MscS family membrane protein
VVKPPDSADVPELLKESRLLDLMITLGTAIAIGLVAWLIARLLAHWLTGKTRFGLHGLERLAAPVTALVSVIVALVIVSRTPKEPAAISRLLKLLISIVSFWLGARVIDVLWATARKSARMRTRPRVGTALVAGRHLGKLALVIAAVTVVAVQLGASGQLYVIVAAMAAGLAFAARDPVRNAIAFVSMAIDPPFHVGDRVRISDYRSGESTVGTITDISLTSITLLTREATNVVIANVMVGQLRVENLSVADRRRLELEFPVGGIDTESLRAACLEIDRDLRENPDVSSAHDPHVWLAGAGDELHLKVSLWLRRAADRRDVQREVLLKMRDRLAT